MCLTARVLLFCMSKHFGMTNTKKNHCFGYENATLTSRMKINLNVEILLSRISYGKSRNNLSSLVNLVNILL
jgi:hypothetical protein